MGFFKSLSNKPTPKEVAKDRLKLILIHDRGEIPPETIKKIKEEILEVISKYIDIQVDDVEISVNKNDDEDKVKAASEEFKTLKKSLKTVYDVQKKRLKIALINGRKWTVDLWNNVFVNNPLMSRFANSIVWGVYENDKLIDTFRYGEMEHLIL